MPGKHMKQDANVQKPTTASENTQASSASPARERKTPSHAAPAKTTARHKQAEVVAPEPVMDIRPAEERIVTKKTTHKRDKKRQRDVRKLVSNILIVLGVVLLLVAGGMWGFAQYRYHVQEQVNAEAQQYVTITETNTDEGEPSGAPVVDWASLKAINEDVVGWIYVPNTVVNYPVYQGVDNDQYLRHTARGEWSIGGQVFLDYQNTAPGLIEQQSIIYGHHLEDGTMFQPISRLDNQEVFDATDTIWYVTETANYELEPLLVYLTEADDDNVRRFTFEDDAAFRTYLSDLLAKSVARRSDAEEIISLVGHVFTMSTCNYYNGIGRTEVVCVVKSEIEDARNAAKAAAEAERQAEEQNQAEEGEWVEEDTWSEEGEWTEETEASY